VRHELEVGGLSAERGSDGGGDEAKHGPLRHRAPEHHDCDGVGRARAVGGGLGEALVQQHRVVVRPQHSRVACREE
jgi:hypothetical protein